MRPKSMILILIALGCGLIASIGISQVVERGGEEEKVKTALIYVAVTDIDIAGLLNEQSVKSEEWPIDRIPEGAVRTAEQLEGMAPKQRLFAGEPIILGKLAEEGTLKGPADRIKPGYRVMSVKVSMDTAVSHLIQPGDRVDILAFVRGSRGAVPKAEIVLTNVEVFAINSRTSKITDEEDQTIQAKTVSLQVTPDQASKLVFFAEQGKLRLTLRSPEDAAEESEGFDFNNEPEPVTPTMTPIFDPGDMTLTPEPTDQFKMQIISNNGGVQEFTWDNKESDSLPDQLKNQPAAAAAAGDPTAPMPAFGDEGETPAPSTPPSEIPTPDELIDEGEL